MALDLTCGGKLSVHPFVTERKVLAMAEQAKAVRLGGYAGQRARADFVETLSTSDAPFSFAHLVNIRNLPVVEEEIPNFDPITVTEQVPDFDPLTFSNLVPNFAGLEHGKDNDGERIAPLVAELDTYQHAFGYTQESTDIAVQKRGFKVDWSLEAQLKDPFGFVTRLPGDMLRVGRKTDEYVVIRALINGVTAASELDPGVDFITGAAVPANSPATPAALRVAIRQIGQRVDSRGVRVPTPARFHLVVAQGAAEGINWSLGLARGLYSVEDTSIVYRTTNTPADPLGRIASVIESEFVTGDQWYLVPAAGTTDRPALVRVQLAGYTIPEVYVSNFNGIPIAGGASPSPFQAYSFDNDSLSFKFRMFTNAGLYSELAVVWSDGTAT